MIVYHREPKPKKVPPILARTNLLVVEILTSQPIENRHAVKAVNELLERLDLEAEPILEGEKYEADLYPLKLRAKSITQAVIVERRKKTSPGI